MPTNPMFQYYLRLTPIGLPYAAFQSMDVAIATAQALVIKFPQTNVVDGDGNEVKFN